jgi:hypothetical protein
MIEIKLPYNLGHDPFAWCCENFGMSQKDSRWAWDTVCIYWFRDQADATLFKLRWL